MACSCSTPHAVTETCPDCAPFGPFERNNYFTGKFMTELDFKIETLFHMDKMRHHNSRLHGSGVVCGLKVVQDENRNCRDRFVLIQPGTAIDCCGHEIVLRETEHFQFDQLPEIQALVKQNDGKSHRLQICLRWRECPTENVPVLYDDCGCDDTRCAPNRILESFQVGVLIDAPLDLHQIEAPGLTQVNGANIAHASLAVLHEATHLLYVITADDQNTLYVLDTQNYFANVGSHTFTEKPVGLAVSASGDRVYLALLPASGNDADPRQLVVLDQTKLTDPPLRSQEIPNSGGNGLVLSTRIDVAGQALVILPLQSGALQIWPDAVREAGADITPDTVAVAANVAGLAFSTDGQTAFSSDPANNLIKNIDLAGKVLRADITVLPAGIQPVDVVVAQSTGPDRLVVLGSAGPGTIHLVGIGPDALLGSRSLDHTPRAVAVAPGGSWAYVLEVDVTGSYIQPVNLPSLQQDPARALGPAIKAGTGSTQVLVTDSGRRLLVPFTDDLNIAGVGGVAQFEVDETACAHIFWKSLDGCPGCDTGDCLVLATIEHYQPGFQLLDLTDPPSDPQDDQTVGVARIDNRRGRKLLPSTELLAEAIQCLLTRDGGHGDQGPPGDPGQSLGDVQITYIPCDQVPQKPVVQDVNGVLTLFLEIPDGCIDLQVNHIGCDQVPDARLANGILELDLPPALKDVKVVVNKVRCEEAGGGNFGLDENGDCTLFLDIPTNCDQIPPVPPDYPHICAINWPHDGVIIRGTQEGQRTLEHFAKYGLLIAFDKPVLAETFFRDIGRVETLARSTIQVLFRPDSRTTQGDPFRLSCFCDIFGNVTGVTNERLCQEAILNPGRGDTDSGPVVLARFQPVGNDGEVREWPPGEYRIILEGDQVLGEQTVLDPKLGEIHPGVDADHMGPGLQNPPWFSQKPEVREPTGDGVEGGQFFSWFTIVDG